MKIIKCELCTGAWATKNTDLEKQKVCPYCGEAIRGEIEFSEYDSLDKAIYGAILRMGKDILQNPRQLLGFLMDTAPGLKKEIRIFSKIVNEDYVADIRSAFEQELDAAKVTINNKLHHLFVEEEGLSDKWADIICKELYGAILFSKGIGTSRLINVKIIDSEELEPLVDHVERVQEGFKFVLRQMEMVYAGLFRAVEEAEKYMGKDGIKRLKEMQEIQCEMLRCGMLEMEVMYDEMQGIYYKMKKMWERQLFI